MNPSQAERFLIVRLSSLGDLVHTIPVVPVLRAIFPDARIDWVVDSRWRPLIELVEGVDEAIPFPASIVGQLQCVGRLRHARYTCALDIQSRYRSAVLGWLSGSPRRIGRHPEATREPGAAWFYTDRVMPTGKHIAEMNVSILGPVVARPGAASDLPQAAALQFPLRVPQDAASRRLRDDLLQQGLRDYVVISPGGGWTSKCWPPERFGQLAAEIWHREGLRAVINIAHGEEHLARGVVNAAAEAKPVVVSPSLHELVVLLSEARLVVAGDTGPLHLAAALGTRVLALFGDTDPARNGPLPSGTVVQNATTAPPEYLRGDYVRGSAHAPAMLSLTVNQVLSAAEQELAIRTRTT